MCSHFLHGWRFWSIAGTEQPKREPKAKAEKPPKAKKAPATKSATSKPKKGGRAKGVRKGKAVRAAAKADASFGCGVCPETFPTMKAATAHALTHTS